MSNDFMNSSSRGGIFSCLTYLVDCSDLGALVVSCILEGILCHPSTSCAGDNLQAKDSFRTCHAIEIF